MDYYFKRQGSVRTNPFSPKSFHNRSFNTSKRRYNSEIGDSNKKVTMYGVRYGTSESQINNSLTRQSKTFTTLTDKSPVVNKQTSSFSSVFNFFQMNDKNKDIKISSTDIGSDFLFFISGIMFHSIKVGPPILVS